MTITDYLLIALILIGVLNLFFIFKNKPTVDISPQLKENEEVIKNELQRNRAESGLIAKENRQELAESIGDFEKKLTDSLSQKFSQLNEQ